MGHMTRVAFYIDGFNVYHAISELRDENSVAENHLKWLNWQALADRLISSQTEHVVKIVYCSAYRTDDPPKAAKHRQYVSALMAMGVDCKIGKFLKEPRSCRRCGHKWEAPVEKKSDVNLALSLVEDAIDDVFDHAFLVTADSDQVPAILSIANRVPQKKITSVVVTGRRHNNELLQACGGNKRTISRADLEACLLPETIPGTTIRRPADYVPPN